jgi:hypothetical protein
MPFESAHKLVERKKKGGEATEDLQILEVLLWHTFA